MNTKYAGLVLALIFFLLALVLASCGPKPYYETSVGKEKWRYYNKTQYGLQPKHAPKF